MNKSERIEAKRAFSTKIKDFAKSLSPQISLNNAWTIKGIIDTYKTIYPIPYDTKLISKVLELHIFPKLFFFAETIDFRIELARHQNWYPDLTFISHTDSNIKFAVDLKTTYQLEDRPGYCNGFTLGSHGTYFTDRSSTKNIQYPYNDYLGHFCLCVIYSKSNEMDLEPVSTYCVSDVEKITSVISSFLIFAEEKWRLASDKPGSGNTANIGSVKKIKDLLDGNGTFTRYGETTFDGYWANYGAMKIPTSDGGFKKLSCIDEYIKHKTRS